MSWYSTPIQPIDPIVASQSPKPPFRYVRDNFMGTGQNSYVQPPAQDQSQWQSLLNVQPITGGVINQRWGYTPLIASTNFTTTTHINTASYTANTTVAGFNLVNTGSTIGLFNGESITVTGCTNSFFNGTFTILSITSSTAFTVTVTSNGSNQNGTGGTITATSSIKANRLYNYQSDSLGTRAIVVTGSGGVAAFTEAGQVYNSNIFVPENNSPVVRSVTSRNFQYFCDGLNALDSNHRSGDSLKWNGGTTAGGSQITTNWGIINTDVTKNQSGGGTSGNTLGPNTCTTASDVADNSNVWTNVNGVFSNNPSTPAVGSCYQSITVTQQPSGNFNYSFSNIHLRTDDILTTVYGINAVPGSTINGIQVAITYQAFLSNGTGTVAGNLTAQLSKYGATTGNSRSAPVTIDGNIHTVTLGSSSDLWGGAFAPADITSTTFGTQFNAIAFLSVGNIPQNTPGTYTPTVTFNVSYITITVTIGGSAGTSSSSGTGIGILSEVAGGSVNLVLGRVYYLVANNSLTGHFSDLSIASASTGAATNSESNLILATYNDPQVDTKFVLATADGGDPSILYQVPVLAPGLTIASWAINGSNQVTFTGTWFGAPYANGTTFYVGGLSHGSYMNGQQLTTTGSSGTTLQANFTHAADSATEIGIAGNTISAIPNAITYVVDNTPDPTLVLQQPMLFTDQFGNEFGVAFNSPPPAGSITCKHQGRLWMAGVPTQTHSVFFSKSVTELTLPNGFIAGKYEEAWPASNYFDVSDGAESVSALLSDGTTLYIGTQNHVRRLIGFNAATFQTPQIVHPQVGVINQECWQLVYMQGAPAGCIWMTPDFRVIQSDFNTYVDIGAPIQDILNALQSTAPSLAHATFVADGEYDLYILAVPSKQSTYCDTQLVFDLRNRQWYIWQPTNGSLALLYNVTAAAIPQWLFVGGTGPSSVYIYGIQFITDNGTPFNITAKTTWLNLGEPTRRKILNEMQIYGDPSLLVSIVGADNSSDFNSGGFQVVYNRAVRKSPLGTYNVYLSGAVSKYRYYQLTFTEVADALPLTLGGYTISATPMDDL